MNIIVDSTFNPFSYRDLMQPIYDYKQAYEETEAAYSDLVTQTEAWKDIANRENSPEAYAMYKSYSDQLNAIVDDFSQGMNPRNRRQLLGMKRRYASEITPIARASEAMQAANALRDQAGPDAIFEVGRYSSIDDFLHGKTANNKFESRKDIAARTAALAQATAQSILEDPIIKQSMSPQFLEVIQKRGLGSLEELQAAIAGNPAAANRFAQIRNQMISQVGGLDRFDAAGRTAIEGAINEGLYAGLNNYQTSLQQNGEYMTKAQRVSAAQSAASLALQQSRFNYEKQKDQDARDMAAGRKPVAIDPDGTRHYTNGINTWTTKPVKVTVNASNRDAIAASRGVAPNKIPIGRSYYKYSDGSNTYYGTTTGGYRTPGGALANLVYSSPSAVQAIGNTKSEGSGSTTNPFSNKTALFTPFYFDATGGTGGAGYDSEKHTSFNGSPSDIDYDIKFSQLSGKGRTNAMKHIGAMLGISNFESVYNKLSAAQKTQLDGVFRVARDQDWFSDNHFSIHLAGYDYDGKPLDGGKATRDAMEETLMEVLGKAYQEEQQSRNIIPG